jgi:hypothetical protein
MKALIYEKMAAIMTDIDPIAKDRTNSQQGYKFRGVDDVYAAVQQIMAKHGVVSLPEVLDERTEDRVSNKGYPLIYRVLRIKYTFYAADGSCVSTVVIGEGMDSGDKASNKAMSVADKYSLLQAFKIPTVDPKDPEEEEHDLAPNQNAQKTSLRPPTPAAAPTPAPQRNVNGSNPAGDWIIPFGKKYKGQRIKDLSQRDLEGFAKYLLDSAEKQQKPLSRDAQDFITYTEAYLNGTSVEQSSGDPMEGIPF